MPHRVRFARATAAFAVAAAVLLGAPRAAAADDYKIGVINTDRILRESAPARDARSASSRSSPRARRTRPSSTANCGS